MISAYQEDMQTCIHKLTVIKFASSSLLLLPQSKQSCQNNKIIKYNGMHDREGSLKEGAA